ncbi:MAG: transposase [Patescibacteria group bacterium]|nr:transposase [Patescibacteria group bacterium]
MLISYQNRPPHIYSDNSFYFLTARTLKGIYFFNTDSKKKILLNVIRKALERYNCDLYAWVILSNHYHLLLKIKLGKELSSLIKNIHANSSRILNIYQACPSRKIWWNYWDKCIETPKSYYTHLNYIHHNPVKHGYTKNMKDYKFSSYRHYLKTQGKEWLEDSFCAYPVITKN